MSQENKDSAVDDGQEAAIDAWEAYLDEQKRILGMPGLHARPCFLAGYRAALRALTTTPETRS